MYLLMLKDRVIATITIQHSPFQTNVNIDNIVDTKLLPLGIQSGYYTVYSWLESRYILAYKRETKEFFATLGINSLEQFIDITNCASLNDCYWVKSANSNKTWNRVSLFRNSFNENIAHYSFTGKIINKNVGSSPDFSTDGSFPKCWKRIDEEIYLLKAGSSGASNAGYEPYSEIFACQLAKFLDLPIIWQELSKHKDTVISKSKCICNENVGLVKMNELHNKSNTDFKWLIYNYKDIPFVHEMLMFDYLTCNVDRHFGNIWLYINVNTNAVIGFTGICDNNLSCIPYYNVDESLHYYINDIRAKDGRTWKELLQLIDKDVVKRLAAKASKFKFKPLGDKKGDSRVDILNQMLKYQLEQISEVIK